MTEHQFHQARRIAVAGMVISGLLAVMKLLVGWFASSAALRADGFESAADVLASGLVYVGLTIASIPPDDNHPYGHGRVETLTGLLLGFLLLTAGVLIAWHGIAGAAEVVKPPRSYAVWPLGISIVVKCGMMWVKFRHGKLLGSSSLLADAANDAIDMLSGAVALGAILLTLHDPVRFLRADHYGAFAVGLIVIATGIRIIRVASFHLIDTMPEDDFLRKIRAVAMSVDEVRGVEKCRARRTGLRYHVDLHLEVDAGISVREAHEIAGRVRVKIRAELPWVEDVLIHIEPFPGSVGTGSASAIA